MQVISVIEEEEIIKKILKHLGLWAIKARPPPKATGKTQEYHLDNSTSQLPALARHLSRGSDTWPPYQVRAGFMLTLNLPICNMKASIPRPTRWPWRPFDPELKAEVLSTGPLDFTQGLPLVSQQDSERR